jgi:putative Mg2+ transporter-C (MgtC) family protein
LTILQQIGEGIRAEFSDLPDVQSLVQLLCRLALAALFGGLLGWQREKAGKAAGIRTHMLVCLGAALFVGGPEFAGMDLDGQSRIVQGITTGIGFIGAGAILKMESHGRIFGLTTAAGIWMTAAIGVVVGMGREATAFVSTLAAFLILWLLPSEHVHTEDGRPKEDDPAPIVEEDKPTENEKDEKPAAGPASPRRPNPPRPRKKKR